MKDSFARISNPDESGKGEEGVFNTREMRKILRKPGRPSILSKARAQKILLLRSRGMSWRHLSMALSVPERTIRSWVERFPAIFPPEKMKGPSKKPEVVVQVNVQEDVDVAPLIYGGLGAAEPSRFIPPGPPRVQPNSAVVDEALKSAVGRESRSSAFALPIQDVAQTPSQASPPSVLAQVLGVPDGIARQIRRQARETAY